MAQPATSKNRPARPRAPDLPPFEALDRTHQKILEVLGQFEQLLEHLDANGPDDVARKSAAAIHSFFSTHARQHHEAEETHVFPVLLASGNEQLVQHVQRLQQDHGWLEEDWRELAPQIEAIAQGFNWYNPESLRQGLPIFKALYLEHIGLEESVVYPEAKRLQTPHPPGGRASGP